MDVSSFSTPDLKEIIQALGIETEGLSREELESLLNTLQSSEEQPASSAGGEMSNELNEGALFTDSMIANLVDAHAFDDSQLQIEEDSPLPATAEHQPGQSSVESSAAAAEESESLTEEQQSSIAMFCALTDADTAYAKILLEAADWDVNNATSLFYDGGGRQPSVSTFSSTIPPRNMETNENRAPPLPPDFGPQSEDFAREFAQFQQYIRSQQHGGGAEDEDDMSPPSFERADMYDEDGVRRPDPVRIQRLISDRSVRFEDDVLGRAEDPSVDWMFEPPNDISFPGTLEQARETAQAENKWVLVNIQSHLEFSSQLLNRDTWTNQDLRQIISAHFVFMQRGHTSPQGKRLLSLYRISEDSLPQILIIAPNTGAKVFSYTGLVEPMELSVRLMDFMDKQASKLAAAKPEASQTVEQSTEFATPAEAEKPSVSEGKVLSAPVEAEKTLVDYGPVPAVPAENDNTAIKVSIKLANGKSYMRRYLKTDSVRALFAVAIEQDAENSQRAFDLISRFPARNLSSCLDMTLEACDLAGGQVFHRWA